MIGLIALVGVVSLILLVWWVFARTYRSQRRKGKSNNIALAWAIVSVSVLALPTWDAIPTWIAFNYYSDKDAGIKIFKTLEQWKKENPGVAETLKPYGFKDTRGDHKFIGNSKFRTPLNVRLAYDSTSRQKLFLSVYANTYELVDVQTNEVMARLVQVGSGNAGGLASGGDGWWAFWLIHGPTENGWNGFFELVESAKNIGGEK